MFKKRGLGLECWLMNLLTCAWYVSGVLPGVLIDESPDVRLMCCLMNLLTCACFVVWSVSGVLIDVCLMNLLMNLLTCACFVAWRISWRAPDLAKYKNRLGVKTNTCYATAIAYVFVFPAVALLVTIKSFNSMCRAVKWKAGIASEGQVKGN